MKTIKGKLIGSITVCCVVLVLTLISATLASSSRLIYTTVMKELEETSGKYTSQINQWFTKQQSVVESLAEIATYNLGEKKELEAAKSKLEVNTQLGDLYLCYEDRKCLLGSGADIPQDFDCTTRPWYIETKERQKTYCSSPYLDVTTNQMCSTIATPIYRAEKFVGAVGADVFIENLIQIVDNISIEEGSYAFLIDDQGYIITHQNKDFLPTIDEMHTLNQTYGETVGRQLLVSDGKVIKVKDYDGKIKYMCMQEINQMGWRLGVVVPESIVTSSIIKLLMMSSIIFILGMGLLILVIVIIVNKIMKPIGALKQFASGDFSNHVQNNKQKVADGFKDEIEEITVATANVREQIRQTILGTKGEAVSIYQAVETVNPQMENLNEAIDQVTQSISEISSKANVASSLTNSIKESAKDMGQAVELVARKAEETTTTSMDITNRATAMRENTKESRRLAEELYAKSQSALSHAIEESKHVEEIESLVGEILAISSQTNLLALNASIESARAGEVGKGFAVVASEIGKLAIDTQSAVEKIQGIVTGVVGSVHKLSGSAKEVLDFVDQKVMQDYGRMVETTQQYSEDSSKYVDLASELGAATQELAASIESIIEKINYMNDLNQDIATETEEMSLSTKTVSTNSDGVLAQMIELEKSSQKLTAIIKQFVV